MDDEVIGGWTINPQVRDALRFDRAQTAFNQGDMTLVMVEVEELLGDTPHHPEALSLLADATLDSGDAAGAVAIYEHLLQVVTPDTSVLAALGIARFESCDLHGAISASREAVRLDENNADAHYTLALAMERLEQRSAEGLVALQRAHALDPERFPLSVVIKADEWEQLYVEAMTSMPASYLQFWNGVPVRVEALPALEELTVSQPPLPPTVRGLFLGTPPENPDDITSRPEALRLYATNLARLGSREQIVEAICLVLQGEALDWLGVDELPDIAS